MASPSLHPLHGAQRGKVAKMLANQEWSSYHRTPRVGRGPQGSLRPTPGSKQDHPKRR